MAPRHGDVKCTLGVPLLTCFFGAPAARLGGGVLFQRLPALRSRYRKLRAADEALHGEFAGMTFEATDFWIDLFIVRLTATPEIGTDLQKGNHWVVKTRHLLGVSLDGLAAQVSATLAEGCCGGSATSAKG